MSIYRGFKLFHLTLVTLVCWFSITNFPSNGYCDDWVYLNNSEYFTQYYNSSSIEIDKQNKMVKVWEKRVYTNKGKINLVMNCDRIEIPIYKNIDYSLILNLLDYKNWKFTAIQVAHYSETNSVLFNLKYKPEWYPIDKDSIGDAYFTQLLKNYNIQR